jgi:miniconductance mechanosensitive channel
MNLDSIKVWINHYPFIALAATILLSFITYALTRFILQRLLLSIVSRTKTLYDDLIVENLHPFSIAWLVPLSIIYALSDFMLGPDSLIKNISLFLIIWVSAYFLISLLNGLNAIYENRPSYTGVSIQGYLDIIKILLVIAAVILSISLITGESPLILLSGVGAMTAVLLLIFRDTILSFVASIQIATHDLVKEGDWIEVPSYGADGDVINMTLHTIKVKNFDLTTTVIPTYKMIDAAYKNYRGMQESGGRRIRRAINIDMNSIKFCDSAMLEKYRNIDLISEYVNQKIKEINQASYSSTGQYDWPLDGTQITNLEVFRTYIEAYLKSRPDIHDEKLSLLVRDLDPSSRGLPVEIYAFTKTTVWSEYEAVQGSIFNHLIAATAYFDLRIFQEPSGTDFSTYTSKQLG